MPMTATMKAQPAAKRKGWLARQRLRLRRQPAPRMHHDPGTHLHRGAFAADRQAGRHCAGNQADLVQRHQPRLLRRLQIIIQCANDLRDAGAEGARHEAPRPPQQADLEGGGPDQRDETRPHGSPTKHREAVAGRLGQKRERDHQAPGERRIGEHDATVDPLSACDQFCTQVVPELGFDVAHRRPTAGQRRPARTTQGRHKSA